MIKIIQADVTSKVFKLILVASLSFLVGCQTVAQKKLMAMNVEVKDINSRALACHEGVRRSDPFKKVVHKLYLNSRVSPSLALLSNQELPDDGDVEALYKLHMSQPCRRIEIEAASKVHALFAGYYATFYSQLDAIMFGLVNKSTSWGEANRKLQEVYAWQIREETNLRRVIDSEFEKDHETEIAQRQKTAEALSRWSYQQQVLANQRAANSRHITTNCRWFGNSLNCNSF